jgi:CheY-like chemotaxis protein
MNGRLVLVIEDNELNLKLIRSLLLMNHCDVLAAGNAEDGIELAKNRKPDLILMDIQLPGMDGYTATGIIKRDEGLKRIPIVALTAHAMAGDDEKALEAGCDAYIAKPIDTRAFPEILERLITKESGVEKRISS